MSFQALPLRRSQRVNSREAELRGVEPGVVKQLRIDAAPLGRLETPEYVTKVAACLASVDEAFVNGQFQVPAGGREKSPTLERELLLL